MVTYIREKQLNITKDMLIDAAAIIIPLMKKKVDILNPSCLSDLNCYASIWCSIENVWLAAVVEGYGCNVRIPLGNDCSERSFKYT